MSDGFAGLSVDEFLGAVAAKQPTPGGGAAASVVGALSAALAQMVVNYSIGKKALAEHEPLLRGAVLRLERARELLLGLAEEDAQAYGLVNELSRLPEDHPRRKSEMPEAVRASVQVPRSTAAACVDLLRLFLELAPRSNRHLRSDLAIAAVLADATARASRWNILVNAETVNGESDRAALSRQINTLLSESALLCQSVERACER